MKEWLRVIGWPKPGEVLVLVFTTSCAVIGGLFIGSLLRQVIFG